MKKQESQKELIITFDEIQDSYIPWNNDIKRLLAIIEKEKKK
jgi:hypothetical protein